MGYKYQLEDVLNIGYDVLRINGYHNVGINQILKEMNIPKGSFYNFFESKEDFAIKVIKHYGRQNANNIEAFFNNTTLSSFESLKSFYQYMININEKDDFKSGCIVNNMSIEVGRINNSIATVANEEFLTWLKILATVIEKGQKEKEITTKYTALELAEYLHSGFYGSFSRMKVTRSKDYMDRWLQMSFDFIKK